MNYPFYLFPRFRSRRIVRSFVMFCVMFCSHYVVKNIHGSLDRSLCVIIAFNQLWLLCRCCLARNGISIVLINDRLALVQVHSHIIAETAVRLLPSCKTSKFAWSLIDCFLQSQSFLIGWVNDQNFIRKYLWISNVKFFEKVRKKSISYYAFCIEKIKIVVKLN